MSNHRTFTRFWLVWNHSLGVACCDGEEFPSESEANTKALALGVAVPSHEYVVMESIRMSPRPVPTEWRYAAQGPRADEEKPNG